MNIIEPSALERMYREWIRPYIGTCKDKHLNIDGKTICGVERNGQEKVHMVSVWINEDGVTLGQTATAKKSNEKTAIPELLNDLEIAGGIVTIDAMGCEKKIAEKIVNKMADYVLAVKKNQKTMYEDMVELFPWAETDAVEKKQLDIYQKREYGHGRAVKWKVEVSHDIESFEWTKGWKDIKSLVMVETTCEYKGKESMERRYYISSLRCGAEAFLRHIRGHWGIEDSLHWVLDVQFGEDACGINAGNAPRNLSLLRKIGMTLMNAVKRPGLSYHSIQVKASLNNDFLMAMIYM
jgi:predicted transposase YbfD/YdcC